MKISNLIVFLFLSSGLLLEATNSAQWRGPDRNGVFPEENLLKQWPEEGPNLLWTAESIGNGYSSVSVSDDFIYVTGRIEDDEFLSALDFNGTLLWQIPVGTAAKKSFREARSTPTVENNRIYLITGSGEVVCVDNVNKEVVWSVSGREIFNGEAGSWGTSESPLIVDDLVIFTPGGNDTTMVALDKKTGETKWQTVSLKDKAAFVSPLLIEWGGKKIIINLTSNWLFGVDAQDGSILWKEQYAEIEKPTWHDMAPYINTNTPIFHEGYLYVTSGYNHVGVMFKLSEDGSSIEFVWHDTTLDTHHGGVVLVNGCLYGSNWISNNEGNWVCIDWKTGNPKYEEKWNNKGSIISADGMLYCYEERRGNIALLEANPEQFHVISSFRITKGRGPHWAHPVIANGILYMRHAEFLMAYDIREQQT